MKNKIYFNKIFIRDNNLNLYERFTYMNLAIDLGREKERFVTQEGLANTVGVCIPTVRKSLRSLKAKGYIDYTLDTIPSKGRGYTYRIIRYEYMIGD